MFETFDEAKLPLFSVRGKHLWSYVGLRLQNPWFHVQYTVIEDSEDCLTKTLHLSDVNQLLEISRRENVKLEFVDLVSPEYINGSNRWRMEPLQQIWSRKVEESWWGYIFVLENGQRYSYPSPAPEDAIGISQLLFQI